MFTAQDLRRYPTHSEIQLWQLLRARQCAGHRFRRQHQIGSFIADFVCLRKKIIVELDDDIHEKRKEYDAWRDFQLELLGFQVLRFQNDELEKDPRKVIATIRDALLKRPWLG